jgi:aspartate aminotransferase
MPKLSNKGIELPISPIRKLAALSDKAKSRGVEVIHLNIGQPDIEAPKEAIDAVINSNLRLLPYGSSEGSLSYRKKLCEYYSTHNIFIKPEDILVTTGASEALTFCLNVICDSRDEIIIPEPFYANYNGFASAAGVKVVPIVPKNENDFKIPSVDSIISKINPKTKAILLCNPSNPSGYVCKKEEIEELCELALNKDIFIIIDEVYREFIYGSNHHYSVLSNKKYSSIAIMIDSVSKRYSLCGARVGCVVSKNKFFIEHVLKFAQLRLSPPTYSLIASEAALDAPETYLKNVLKEYTFRRKTLINCLNKIPGVSVIEPMGAFFCITKLPVDDAEDFCKFLLNDFNDSNQTIMLAPAKGFYSSPNIGLNKVRFAFVLESSKLIRAAEILEKALKFYLNQ